MRAHVGRLLFYILLYNEYQLAGWNSLFFGSLSETETCHCVQRTKTPSARQGSCCSWKGEVKEYSRRKMTFIKEYLRNFLRIDRLQTAFYKIFV